MFLTFDCLKYKIRIFLSFCLCHTHRSIFLLFIFFWCFCCVSFFFFIFECLNFLIKLLRVMISYIYVCCMCVYTADVSTILHKFIKTYSDYHIFLYATAVFISLPFLYQFSMRVPQPLSSPLQITITTKQHISRWINTTEDFIYWQMNESLSIIICDQCVSLEAKYYAAFQWMSANFIWRKENSNLVSCIWIMKKYSI